MNFASGVRLELICISLIEWYQVKSHSSAWFSAAFAAEMTGHFSSGTTKKRVVGDNIEALKIVQKVVEI